MNILDNKQTYKKLDTGHVEESINLLSDQIEDVVSEMKRVRLPKEFKKVNKIVVAGMGGSNLGYRIIRAVFKEELKAPILIEAGYLMPGFVDKDTLYILSSYSGNTEEPLSTYKEAKKRGAKIIAVTSDDKKSKLFKLVKKEGIPGYIFGPDKNPSGEPRLGLGYSIFGSIALFERTGLLKFDRNETGDLVRFLRRNNNRLKSEVPSSKNMAKKIAKKLFSKHIVLVGSELLLGNLHTSRNEFCECSKNFSSYLEIPDMNHFALEALNNPKSNKKNLVLFFLESSLYHEKTQKRLKLTKEVVRKNKISQVSYKLKGKTKLIQAFESLQVSMWVAYYLAILNNEDPSYIPWVDWFKDKLKK